MAKTGKKRLLSITATARLLGIDRHTLVAAMHEGPCPRWLILGKRRYFTREVIEQWIKAQSAASERIAAG